MKTMPQHLGKTRIFISPIAIIFLIGLTMLFTLTTSTEPIRAQAQKSTVRLKSREFVPDPGIEREVQRRQQEASPDERIHVLMQFHQIPSAAEQAALENAGVQLLAYVPDNTWFVSIPAKLSLPNGDALSKVRWVGVIQPDDRTAPNLRTRAISQHAVNDDGTVSLDIRFFADVSNAQATQLLAKYNAVIETKTPEVHRFTIRLDRQAISSLANEDAVQWITEAAPPKIIVNDGARAQTNVDAVQAAPYNLSGSGVDLGEWDGGRVDTHPDFSGRLTVVEGSAPLGDHATHVAGTMAGDGSNSAAQGGTPLQWRGMATAADIFSYYWDNNVTDHNGAINVNGIELSQNSWGFTVSTAFGNCDLYGDYDLDAPDYDDIITGLYGNRISVVFAAGNERDDGDCGMSPISPYLNYANVGPPSTAKNVIAVGAANSNDDSMTDFSSWGPLDDGRLKPDVVAPGCESTGEGYIHSTLPGGSYGGPLWCGTSMAAPTVSGIAGLLIEQYRATFSADPLPATLKAILVQTAVDLDDGTSYYNSGPDYASGYGRVDAQAAADLIIAQAVREDQVSHGQLDAFTFNVTSGTPIIKVTLAWDDEPGTVNANPALVNNLDLVLVEPDGTTTHLPWVLDSANPANNATTGVDSINNIEQVQVNNPVAGTWQVQVVGTSVPTGLQGYSLAGQTFTPVSAGNVGPAEYDSHTIDDDNSNNSSGNADGLVDAGETIELYVDLRNTGSDAATGVNACLTEDSPYVNGFLFNNCSDYDDIPGGGTGTNLNDFDFAVDPAAPDGHLINLTLTVNAGNGGPWTDTFSIMVHNTGSSIRVALISDQTELQAITSILNEMGLAYDVVNNNWDGSQGIYTSDFSFLSNYEVVIWYGSGVGFGRLTTQAEHDALELYLQSGRRLLVTGYDTLGSPTDTLLADLVRSSSSGDGPFTYNYTVTDGSHPIMNGPFGSFPTGTALLAGHSDHDQAEADTGRNAATVAELSGGRDKIMATDLDPAAITSGRVVYWNGNRNARDWAGLTTTTTQDETGSPPTPEVKRRGDGQEPFSAERLAAQAERLNPADIPPEANYGGNGPALRLDSEVIPASLADPVALANDSTTFIAGGDTVNVQFDPYWWNDGDYAEGVRTLNLDTVEHVDYTLIIGQNVLNNTGHVDLQLSINGIVVGSFTVLPGELVKNVSFDFPAIAGPTYTIRLEETNTVDPGAGSITLPPDLSTLMLSSSQPDILKNTIAWLAEGAGTVGGDPHEPNDDPATCTDIFFDVPVTDPTIDPAGDWDYFCFSGNGGQTIAADVDAWEVGSSLDPVLTLFDTDGTTILAQNDDYGSLDSYLEHTLPGDGVYYLRVRSFGHPCCGGPDYTYALLLTDITQPVSLPFFDDMESGPNGWGAAGFWHQVEDGVSPYPNSFSPTHSWWYGQDATGDYDNGGANSGSLTSPPIEIPAGIQANLSFWQWYETEPILLPQTIYFDVYHDTDGDDNISGGIYTDWAAELSSFGFTITEYNQPIEAATLSGHQVLALFDPEVPFSPAELTAINDFMLTGGRVVILGEFNDFNGVNTVLNDLTTGHGITLNSDVVEDSTDNDGQGIWPLISNFADEPLVRGANTAVLYAGSSLSLGGTAIPLATGDNDASATVFSSPASQAVEGGDENAVGFEQLVQPLDIVPGAPVVMAYSPVGAGQLIAIGDSGLWTNEDPDGDSTLCLYEYDNLFLAFRLFGQEVDAPAWDQKWVQISVDGGPFQNLLQVTGGPMRTWHQTNINLSSFAGSTVRVRFYFDTIDSFLNGFKGWYLDDFLVQEATNPPGPIVYSSQLIDDDNTDNSIGNGDGIANPGETIELYVELENLGANEANNVVACLSEDSSYVNGFLFNDCANYSNIPGGALAVNSDDFDFTIDPAAPLGHIIHFTVDVTADNGGPWSTAFDVVIGGGAPPPGPVDYSNHLVDDDASGQSSGNGDGQPNPGETIELYVDLFNAGLGTALGVNACLEEGSPYVSGFLFNVCSNYGNIPGGGLATNTDDFDFTIDPLTPPGHTIPFTMTVTALNGGPWVSNFNLTVVDTGLSLRLVPADQDAPLSGGNFIVNIVVDNAVNLGAFEFDLVYDPAIVHVSDVNLGNFLGSTGRTVSEVGPTIDNTTGRTTYGAFSLGSLAGPDGSGILATVILNPQSQGDSDLVLENYQLTDIDGGLLATTATDGHVTVTDTFFADVDGDGDVDIVDVQLVAGRHGCTFPESCYHSLYDMDNDMDIDVADVQIVACYWGWPSGDFSSCYVPTVTILTAIETQSGAIVSIKPTVTAVDNPGDSFTVNVEVADATNLGAFGFELYYDPAIVEVDNVTLGSFLGSTGRTVGEIGPTIDNVTGQATYAAYSIGSAAGPDGSGVLARIDMTSRAVGATDLDLQSALLADISGNQSTPTIEDGAANVAVPALELSKTAQPDPVTAGNRLTYTLTISNLSTISDATSVDINDEIPDDTEFAWADSGGTESGNQVQWTGQSVGAGSILVVRFAVTVSEFYTGTVVTNSVYNAFANDQGISAAGGNPVTTEVTPSQGPGVGDIYLPLIMKNSQ